MHCHPLRCRSEGEPSLHARRIALRPQNLSRHKKHPPACANWTDLRPPAEHYPRPPPKKTHRQHELTHAAHTQACQAPPQQKTVHPRPAPSPERQSLIEPGRTASSQSAARARLRRLNNDETLPQHDPAGHRAPSPSKIQAPCVWLRRRLCGHTRATERTTQLDGEISGPFRIPLHDGQMSRHTHAPQPSRPLRLASGRLYSAVEISVNHEAVL